MAKAVKKKKLAKKTTPKKKAKAGRPAKAKPKRSYVKRTQAEVRRPKRKYTRKEKGAAEVPGNLVALVKVGLDWMTDILREIAGINKSLEKLARAGRLDRVGVDIERNLTQYDKRPQASAVPTAAEVDALIDDEIVGILPSGSPALSDYPNADQGLF